MKNKLLAGQFALGALSPGERADIVARRLADSELDGMIDDHEAMFAPLAGLAGEMTPPPGLKERVMAAMARVDAFEAQGKRLSPFESGNWRSVFPGVDMKRIWAKGPKLMRCAPASVIPPHEHLADEHLVVLSGDFILEGHRFCLGDHLFSPRGTRHDIGTTETGCVLLIQDD